MKSRAVLYGYRMEKGEFIPDETEYCPDESVQALEIKVHEALENHTLERAEVRMMILDLAAKKYNCISQRGEPL